MNKKVLITLVIIIAVLVVFAIVSPSKKEGENTNTNLNDTEVQTNEEEPSEANQEPANEEQEPEQEPEETDQSQQQEDEEEKRVDKEIKDFSAPDFPEDSVFLTELTPVKGDQDYLTLKTDQSVWERDLVVDSIRYEKGLGAHANSEYTYKIDGEYSTFKAYIGIDDEDTCENEAIFVVKGDGETLYESDAIAALQQAQPISVSVKDVNELTLITKEGKDDNSCDHTNWLYPVLIP